MLRAAQVTELVDVRSIPRSRTHPQYNLDVLPTTLAEYQINHTYIEELGGRRPRQRSIDPQLNGFWQNQSFHHYADYALSSDFHTGYRRLLELSQRQTCAIMCSEAVCCGCHRKIVADYLLDTVRSGLHLMGQNPK